MNSAAVSFTHGLIRGFCIVVDSCTGHETVNSSPLWSAYVFFPAALVVQNGSLFPTLLVICMMMRFGAVVFPPVGIVFVVVFGTV